MANWLGPQAARRHRDAVKMKRGGRRYSTVGRILGLPSVVDALHFPLR